MKERAGILPKTPPQPTNPLNAETFYSENPVKTKCRIIGNP
ncbi:hypothetical protein B4098_1053 [Heyndrickxia coagulans]|uniref:Uncharacterized protein n=1 Tax=Heyndrickxia coagulans TaxID=1398 RepID=A0A150JYU6_HEYCO|nr:hypothetical protein B4098_1053 [Heyndrickxia coagulans]